MGDALDRLIALTSQEQQDEYDDYVLALSVGKLDRSPKSNWVEDAGGLPAYIEEIADSLHRKRGMDISRAIATAVSRCKKWAAGGENVNPDTRAKAAKAIAQWEALKAKARAKKAVD
jgi:hypothetical protein